LLAVALLVSVVPASAAAAPPSPVTRDAAASPPTAKRAVPEAVARTNQVVVTWDAKLTVAQAKAAVRVDRLSQAVGRGLAFGRQLDGRRSIYRLDAPLGDAAEATIAALASADGVVRVEPDLWVTTSDLPNDPLTADLWGLLGPMSGSANGIDAVSAWPTSRGWLVTVAVIDTGILDHPDLVNQALPGHDMISLAEVSNDGDGRDDDPSDPGDACGNEPSSWHGTHVAGTIAANVDNGTGVFGGAPDAKLLPVRVLGTCGGFISDIADGIRWAAGLAVGGAPANTNPARVLNLSLGGEGACPSFLEDAIADARDAGAVVVVAAGNEGEDSALHAPANCPGSFPVAAIAPAGLRAQFSNYGPQVRIAAPGTGIISTIDIGTTDPQGGTYGAYSGTSMATPHVSVIAALLGAKHLTASPDAIEAAIELSARPHPPSSDCRELGCGSGIANAPAALAALAGPWPWLKDVVVRPETVSPGESYSVTATALDVDGVGLATASVDGGPLIVLEAADGAFGEPREEIAGTLTAPADEGSHQVCVAASDGDGDTMLEPVCDTVIVASDLGPAVTVFEPTSSPTNATTATFALEFDEPVTGLSASDMVAGGTSTGWNVTSVAGSGAMYTVTISRSSPANGTVIPSLAPDSVTGSSSGLIGPMTTAVGETLLVDRTLPVGFVVIEDDASTTDTRNVTVEVAATDVGSSVIEVALSNDGTTFTTLPYDSSMPWTLSAGDGLKIVRVRWRDAAGNWSAVVADDIVLDQAMTGTTFTPVNPVRMLDTRFAIGLSEIFRTGQPRTFQITGRLGIPSDAVAVTGNLTIVGQTARGVVSLGPVTTTNPTTSSLNAPKGDTRANNVTVPLSASGGLSAVYKSPTAGATTHLILDVTGYFRRGGGGASYIPLQPSRLLDSRFGNGVTSSFKSGTVKTFQVAGRGGVLSDAVAVTGNLTIVGQTGSGFASVAPSFPSMPPTTSTINAPKGDTRANGLTVRLSPTGRLAAVYVSASGGSAHLIFDVTGYYRNDPTGFRFVPLAPARILDTRDDTGLADRFTSPLWRTMTVGGLASVPTWAIGMTGNLTIVAPTAKGFVTLAPFPVEPVTTSTLNAPAGDTRANGVTSAIASNRKVALTYRTTTNGARTHLLLDVTGYFR
jgi:serine protease